LQDNRRRATIIFVLILFRRSMLIAFTALGLVVVGVTRGSASTADLPSLYVTYNTQCHFTMALDSGAPVASGSAIPYGEYQLIISTPVPFATGLGGCNYINFVLTGPGVNYSTQLGEGDETEDFSTQSFTAGSSYTASDSTVAPGTTITFSTSSTPVTASSGPTSSSPGNASNAKPTPSTDSPTKQTTSNSNPVVNRGTLEGIVSASGKLSLAFDGKPVTEITAGRYKVQVTDQSHKEGFTIQQVSKLATTVTGISFVGKRMETIVLSAGQSLFYPSFTGKKSYFLVVAAH
jgi:hypothetical protein